MKPFRIGAILAIGALALWLILDVIDQKAPPSQPPGTEVVASPLPPPTPVLGDTMLAGYAGNDSSPKEDLRMLATFLDSVFLLVKQRDTADYATNQDLALFLLGKNSHQSPFLRESSPALNDQGQLIDRWATPIIIHPVSPKLLEIRFAGPDRKPYTQDDLTWPPVQ